MALPVFKLPVSPRLSSGRAQLRLSSRNWGWFELPWPIRPLCPSGFIRRPVSPVARQVRLQSGLVVLLPLWTCFIPVPTPVPRPSNAQGLPFWFAWISDFYRSPPSRYLPFRLAGPGSVTPGTAASGYSR